MTQLLGRILGCCLLVSLPGLVRGADPLNSPSWDDLRRTYFHEEPVVFDDRIKVTAPLAAENPLNVPVAVDASALAGVREVRVLADLNPIVQILSFEPVRAAPRLAFRVKLQQSTPLRAAALGPDGIWHLGGTWINTTGGGCTLPSTGSASPEWHQRLNQVSGRIWRPLQNQTDSRLRFRLIHPMDTGLAPGIPAFFIQQLLLSDESGAALMRIRLHEPVSENPLFSFDLPPAPGGDVRRVRLTGADNNGNRIQAWIE